MAFLEEQMPALASIPASVRRTKLKRGTAVGGETQARLVDGPVDQVRPGVANHGHRWNGWSCGSFGPVGLR